MITIPYCEHHQSEACNPAKCEHVRLYHVTPQKQHEILCEAPFYADWHIENELDCVLIQCASADSRRAVQNYARARKTAPGYDHRSYSEGERHNSHGPWMLPTVLDDDANARCADQSCGRPFEAKRSTARYRSDACRKRSNRAALPR